MEIPISENLASIGKMLGGGGFAEVYECKTVDGTPLAIKILKKNDATSKSRFVRETRLLNSLNHPNIVKVVGKNLTSEPFYFLMPRYQMSLADKFPEITGNKQDIVPIFSAILNAVGFAHQQGILHRDLKPHNILLNSNFDVVVADFGYGKDINEISNSLTKSTEGFGTRNYACPEQWEQLSAKYVDYRCDIYTLGIILYELYAGQLNGTVPRLESIPADIRYIVDKCTQQKPEDRFQTISELQQIWKTQFEVIDHGSNLSKLSRMAAELSTNKNHPQDILDDFAILLCISSTDADAVNEALLLAGPTVACILLQQKRSIMIEFLKKLCNYIYSQTWPSSKANSLALFCDKLSKSIDDFEIRAHLMFAMINLSLCDSKITNKV